MRILVLGGTAFVGRHIVDAAIDGGHEVTLFNRGKTNSDLFAGVERRLGDREASDLASLSTGEWDAVVDVNGYTPRVVQETASLLAGRVRSYCFISTGSVYAETADVDTDEDSELAELEGDPDVEMTNETYGPLKVLCEREAQKAFPDGALIIRPGIVAGPHDHSQRFGYWVRRLARGGTVLGPQRPDQPLQLVHARDQADFLIGLLAEGTHGVFNTVGPDDRLTFSDMIDACAAAAGTQADVVWAPDKLLRENEVALPLSLPASRRWDGVFRRSNELANKHGFRNRSIAETAVDTFAWEDGRDNSERDGQNLSPAKEAEILALL